MGLSQLLAVGRSVRTIKDGPARYKMTQQNLLPKFGGEQGAEPPPAAAEVVSPPVAESPQPALPEPDAPSVASTEAGSEESDPGPTKRAAFVEATKKLRPFSGWSLFQNPFGRWKERWMARKARTAPLQTELSLELVKPMRNDLSDRS